MALSLEPFDVRSMIDGLVDTVGPLVQKNGNTLTVNYGEDIGTMHADLTKTRQILLNLLSNAGKFTRQGTIAVDVQRRRVDGSRVCRVQRDRYGCRHDARTDTARCSTPSRRLT